MGCYSSQNPCSRLHSPGVVESQVRGLSAQDPSDCGRSVWMQKNHEAPTLGRNAALSCRWGRVFDRRYHTIINDQTRHSSMAGDEVAALRYGAPVGGLRQGRQEDSPRSHVLDHGKQVEAAKAPTASPKSGRRPIFTGFSRLPHGCGDVGELKHSKTVRLVLTIVLFVWTPWVIITCHEETDLGPALKALGPLV
jgi:hypothetical protein